MSVSEQGLAPLDRLVDRRNALAQKYATAIANTTERTFAAKRPASILLVINSLEGGGAERVFSTIANQLPGLMPDQSFEVVLLDDRPSTYQIDESVPQTCLASDGSFWDSARRFKKLLDQRRPQLVLSFLTRANYLTAFFARRYAYRAIISERSDTNGRLGGGVGGWLKKKLVRSLYPRADGIIAVSEGIRRSLIQDFGIEPNRVEVIYNPYDLELLNARAQEPSPIAEQGFILAIGRLVSTKRFDLLIRAYAEGQFQQNLVILGEGPKLDELKALVEQLGVAQKVKFPGFLANPYAVMAQASVYVLCSELEGFPNALVEAMSIGLPVIATNCPHGPAEILDEQVMPDLKTCFLAKHGVLVPSGDVSSMRDALQRVLSDPELRQSLSVRARERAACFTVAETVSRYTQSLQTQLAYCHRHEG